MVADKGESRFAVTAEAQDARASPLMNADVRAAWAVMAALFLALFLLF